MKKTVALLLFLVMLLSLFACTLSTPDETQTQTDPENSQDITDTESADNAGNDEVDKFFETEILSNLATKYWIYDIHGNLVLTEETTRPLNISMVDKYTVEIRIGMGTGTSVTKYYNAKTNRFSEEFDQVVAASGELVAYLCPVTAENNSADIVASAVDQSLVVQNIFDKNVFYKVYNLDFYPTVMPVESASFTEDNTHLEISYISGYSQTETLHESLPIKAGFYDYESVISLYREAVEVTYKNWDAERICFPYHIGLVDPRERADVVNLLDGVFSFFPRRTQVGNTPYNKYHCGYAIKDLNSDGIDELVFLTDEYYISSIFSMHNGKPVMLGHFMQRSSCWIDSDGNLHINENNGSDCSSYSVYKIAHGGAALELIAKFGGDGVEWIEEVAVSKYYKLVNGEKADITETEFKALCDKYGIYLCNEGTEKFSGLKFNAIYEETAIVRECLEAALKCDITVHVYNENKEEYLSQVRTPYMQIRLCEIYDLEYSYVDMDGDGYEELIIFSGDTFILRFRQGKVYLYSFIFRHMYNIATDGTFSWSYNGENFEYGVSKLVFDGASCKTKELYRIVNDGEPDAEFYVEGKRVSKSELDEYSKTLSNESIKFKLLDKLSWKFEIDPNKAKEIAIQYWTELWKDNDIGSYVIEMGAHTERIPTYVYTVIIKQPVYIDGRIDHYSFADEIWIHGWTGATIVPYDINDGK